MGVLFTMIVIGVFIAYLISPKVRNEIDKSPGITWMGANKYKKKKKKTKYGSDICSLSKKDRDWIENGKWTDKWY